ncbi:MAG TPA: TonB-dependent receptor [Steroidobacteraceae bacterium]
MRKLLARFFVIVFGCSLAFCALAIADEPKLINIPAGDLVIALDALARQSGAEIVYTIEQVGKQRTAGVSGTLSARDALQKLLRGTSLKVTIDSSGAMLIYAPIQGVGTHAVNDGTDLKTSAASYDSVPQTLRLAQAKTASPQRVTASSSVVATDTVPDNKGESPLDELVVTGSRIARAALDQPVPITVINAAAIEESGFTNAGDILNQFSQFGVGTTLSTNQAGYNTDAGATFLNLRGLGTNRTLVLVDGLRRVSGGSNSSAVDLSTIPANMIERIEIITGGASSVYGADAVSGVVNVILKHHAEGLEISARPGISSRGDNSTEGVSALYGQPISDRGEFTFGVSWNHEASLNAERRPWDRSYNCDFPNNSVTASNPYTNIEYFGCRFPNTAYGSAFYIGNTQYTVNPNGTIRPIANGARPLSYLGTGGGDGFNNEDFLILRPQFSVLASQLHFGYDMGANIKLSEDFQFSYTNTYFPVQPAFDYGLTISLNNPYVPAQALALAQQNGMTSLSVGRTDTDQRQFTRVNDRYTFDSVTRLDGELGFGTDFKWMAFYDYGQYNNDSQFQNERIKSRYLQAIDVIAGPNGPECADPTAVAAGCKPLSLFGPNTATAAALKYFLYDSQTRIINTMEVTGAQLTGTAWHLPAGPLAVSAGIEYRKESQTVVADGLGSEGLLFNTYSPSSYANFNVKEAFFETVIPVLKDLPFAKALEGEAAIRESDYDTIGHTRAWKLAAQWAPIDDVRFRVTRSTSVRAPNLTELFSPGSTSVFGSYYDPCSAVYINAGSSTRAANCAKLGVPANYVDPLAAEGRAELTTGNANLTAETAKSWTVGTVLTPRFLPHLTWTIDWWDIDIHSAINTLPVQQVINGCVDGATLNTALCSLIARGGANSAGGNVQNAITNVLLEPLNIGILQAEGIDTSAAYLFDLPTHFLNVSNGVSLALQGSYTMKNNSVVDASNPNNVIQSAGDYTLPKVRLNLTATFLADPILLSAKVRYIGPSKVDVTYTTDFSNDNNVSSATYLDLYGTYQMTPKLKLAVGINNVTDAIPPQTATTYTGTSTLYDVVGRYFFGQVTAKF